jgi:hypothetical protein
MNDSTPETMTIEALVIEARRVAEMPRRYPTIFLFMKKIADALEAEHATVVRVAHTVNEWHGYQDASAQALLEAIREALKGPQTIRKCQCGHLITSHMHNKGSCYADATPNHPLYGTICSCALFVESSPPTPEAAETDDNCKTPLQHAANCLLDLVHGSHNNFEEVAIDAVKVILKAAKERP